MDHRDRTITVELSSASSAGDDLRLDDFLEQLGTFRGALRETERLVSDSEPSLYFRIKRLRKDSPPVVTLEAVSDTLDERSQPRYASYVVRSLTANLRVIANKKRLPRRMDFSALESYRALTIPAEKGNLIVRIQSGTNAVLINNAFRETIDKLSGEDEFSFGSASGKIEAINLHENNKRFQLFPVVGASRIVGTFRVKDRKLFASAVDKYVTVFGKLRYKKWDKFPYAIAADAIEIHDDVESLASLADLKGIAPDATGALSTQEFIDRVNDEW